MAKKKNMVKEEVEIDQLLPLLSARFQANKKRHPKLDWKEVEKTILHDQEKLQALFWMERTGGEPDVVQLGEKDSAILFVDCSAESPEGRRSLCYDEKALEDRKEFKPSASALSTALLQGTEMLNEEEYFALQAFGPFDQKTSSWLLTPAAMRKQGGALFGDHRFGRTFIYHNGASSYYAGRGFRVKLSLVR